MWRTLCLPGRYSVKATTNPGWSLGLKPYWIKEEGFQELRRGQDELMQEIRDGKTATQGNWAAAATEQHQGCLKKTEVEGEREQQSGDQDWANNLNDFFCCCVSDFGDSPCPVADFLCGPRSKVWAPQVAWPLQPCRLNFSPDEEHGEDYSQAHPSPSEHEDALICLLHRTLTNLENTGVWGSWFFTSPVLSLCWDPQMIHCGFQNGLWTELSFPEFSSLHI